MDIKKFSSSRQQGYLRAVAIEPVIAVGQPLKNARRHAELFRKAWNDNDNGGFQIGVSPELGFVGYTAHQLFSQRLIRTKMLEALESFLIATSDINALLCVGVAHVIDNQLYNCLDVCFRGEVIAVIVKSYQPVNGNFRESDRFSKAKHLTRKSFVLFGKETPVGNDILVEVVGFTPAVIGFEICEDGWVKVTPLTRAFMNGANFGISTAASNEVVGKPDWRRILAKTASGQGVSVGVVYVSSGRGESTTDMVFGGHKIAAEAGDIVREDTPFAADDPDYQGYMVVDFDLHRIEHDSQVHSYSDCNAEHQEPFRRIPVFADLGRDEESFYQSLNRYVDPYPFVPANAQELIERCEFIRKCQRRGLATRVSFFLEQARKKNPDAHCPAVLGISGGVDSTLALLIAVDTYDFLGLPREDIIAITMPSFGTTEGTKSNALELAFLLGVTVLELPIGSDDHHGIANMVFDLIGHDTNIENLTFKNVQAIIRMLVLYAKANQHVGFVLGTGDWSESLIGWLTKYGDGAYDYGVNGGLAKTMVQFVIRIIADTVYEDDEEIRDLLYAILDTPVSGELGRPRGEVITDKTDDQNGPVTLRDFFGYQQERYGFTPLRIAYLAQIAFSRENNPSETYALADIKRYLEVFEPKVFGSGTHKRDVLPPNPKVGLSNSARYDNQKPADFDPIIWMEEVAEIPA